MPGNPKGFVLDQLQPVGARIIGILFLDPLVRLQLVLMLLIPAGHSLHVDTRPTRDQPCITAPRPHYSQEVADDICARGMPGSANNDVFFSAGTVAMDGTAFGEGFKGQIDTGFMADPARDIFCCAVQHAFLLASLAGILWSANLWPLTDAAPIFHQPLHVLPWLCHPVCNR
jgi:hypothetical protein